MTRKLLALALSLVVTVIAAEFTARAFFWFYYGVPFTDPGRVLYTYYPELRQVDDAWPSRSGQYYDVLLLGESVLHREWGEVEPALREALAYSGHRNVRIFNLAEPAHTSRDSWLKYAALDRGRFQLVIVYDGINETRANNAPPELFRDDYGHYAWYATANALAPYHPSATLALPYTLRYLSENARSVLHPDRYVPTHSPRPEWLQYGAHPRTPAAFERNIESILNLAAQRGDRVMLMTFATYVPEHYTIGAFKEKRLDYGLHLNAIEIWGKPENVLATVAAHNDVIRSLAARHPGVLLVDQARLMVGSNRFFNDVCHLTLVGSQEFAEHIVAALQHR